MNSLEFVGFAGMLTPEFAIRFFVAVLCGGALGMERETTGKPAGLRTCILVCAGSMLFTEVGIAMSARFGGDSMRIAAQIVTGIGFLGAGVILHARQGEVRGVTTAAMIWLMAALGMMIGAGYILTAIAVTTATVVMILLLRRVEGVIRNRRARDYCFALTDGPEARRRVTTLLNLHEDAVRRLRVTDSGTGICTVTFRFVGTTFERRELLTALALIKGVGTIQRVQNAGGITIKSTSTEQAP